MSAPLRNYEGGKNNEDESLCFCISTNSTNRSTELSLCVLEPNNIWIPMQELGHGLWLSRFSVVVFVFINCAHCPLYTDRVLVLERQFVLRFNVTS